MVQARPGDPGRPDAPALGRLGGTVAGRYRLDERRPTDLPEAERWSATDTILARPVAVTLVSGPRTAAVLDAARRAALVVEPRLARILDVGTADGTGYVVTAAVEGRSLAALAARAPLPADQARAVVGEAAAALEAARRRGVHHLALRPEAVVLTPGGRVVLEGLAVDGELVGAAGGTAHAMSRADAVGLVRVLYAALTGRWPAVSAAAATPVPSFAEWSAGDGAPARAVVELDAGLPAAPEHDGAALPPVDLVPGVPADLDTLCAVTLGPHDDGPHSPGELVRELEPWRAVRADEVFRAADAGRWPALPSQGPGAGTAAAAAGAAAAARVTPARGATPGTTTAPPTGSSPMSDDQQPASDDTATPATGSASGAARPGSAAGASAATGAGAAGAAAGSAAAGAGTGAVGAGSTAAGAVQAASATTGAAGAGAAGAGAAGVARQSVRSAFGSTPSAGSRRPGTPPPAIPPAGQPAAIPPAGRSPARTSTRGTPAVPARTPGTAAPGTPAPGTGTTAPAAPADPSAPAAPAGTGAPADAGRATAPTPPATPATPPAVPPARSASPAEPAPAAEPAAEPAAAPAASAASSADATRTEQAAPASPAREPDVADLAVAGITGAGGDDRDGAATDAAAADDAPGATGSATGVVRRATSVFRRPAAERTTPAATAGTAAAGTAAAGTAAAGAAVPAAWTPPVPGNAEEPPVFEPAGPAPAPAAGDHARVAADPADDTATRPAWDLPFPAEDRSAPLAQRRIDPTRWVLGGVALAVVIGLVIAINTVLAPFRSPGDADAAPAPAPATSAPAEEQPPAEGEDDAAGEEAPAAVPPAIAAVTTLDPSDGDGEHEELVGRLTDGDPATTWYTHTYNRPDYAGFKDAVGLVVTLQQPATVTAITLDVNGSGGAVEVRSTDAANPTAGEVLASGALAPQTVLTLTQPTETQSLVLWFPALAQTPDGQNRIEISNLTVS